MPALPPGWETDLAVLRHTGSVIEDRTDHLVIRSPHNPDYHWGNCLLVTDENAVDDAARWEQVFRAAFPDADWVAIGLTRMPERPDEWLARGLTLEEEEALTSGSLPRRTPPPSGLQGAAARRR